MQPTNLNQLSPNLRMVFALNDTLFLHYTHNFDSMHFRLLLPSTMVVGEGNDNPLQHSCPENPMDRGAWQDTVHGVARVGYNLATKLLLHWLTTYFLQISPNKTPVVGRRMVSHRCIHPNPWLSHYIEFAGSIKVSNQPIRD